MSEVNLPALDHHETESKVPTPMQEINLALKACTFGGFHIRLLATSLIATISGVLVTNDIAFLLPIAECDLNMDLKQKGLLTAIPYFGMMFSSIIAGFLTDTFGRKNFIRVGKAGIFVLVLIAGSSQTYIVLLVAKLLQGTLWAVVFTPMITFTSEFCYPEIRDRVMIIHSTFVATSQMIITAISWGFLTNEWKYTFFNGYIVLNTWNFYLYAMSIFSLSAAILYSFLPESPKFLLSQGKYKEVREILIKMYVTNTRKEIETYPYINIWANKINAINESPEKNVETTFSQLIVAGLHNVKPLFKRPLVLYLTLLCTMNFYTMALYNLFRLWFPQLSTIVEHYSFISDDGQRNLCDVLDDYTKDVREKIVNMTVSDVCIPTKSGAETYINNLIVASVCIAPSLISTLLINKISKKFLLFTGGFVATCVTLGLRWVNYKIAVVILFAVAIAVTQFMMSLLQAYSVELFTTSVRALAVSFIMFVGRIGALTGNVTFPILLDIKCIIPFFTLASMMICTMVLSLLLPNKKKT